ncbi:cytochrome P450 9e2-like [Onthophagus taurus]|uniref:cytochrome P450 9e2-like n=1 Tax=Onthophagus taurus TaxID=166361 RepID=UPI0039BDDAB4
MLFLLLIVLLITLIYYKVKQKHSHWEKLGVKHLKPTFYFGNFDRVMFRMASFNQELIRFYESFPNERYVGMYMFTTPVLIIRDPELLKSVFVKDFEHFVDHRPIVPESADPIWTKNLFTLKGAAWKEMRSTLSPTFTSSKMRLIFVLITETVQHHISYLTDNKMAKIELIDTFERFTNDVIASVAFGIKCDSINDRDNEFYAMAKKFTTIGFKETLVFIAYSLFPMICKYLGLNLSPNDARKFLYDVIVETIKIREKDGTNRPDMITLLMEEKKQREKLNEKPLGNEEIVAQAFIFLFAGFNTVANALSFCIYELSRNEQVQRRLQQEIDETLSKNGKLTYENLIKMKYIDQVISETFRLYLPALAFDRVCTKTYTIEPKSPSEKPLTLNPGDLVWAAIPGLQKDKNYFPNPEDFDPERFADGVNSYAYMPFGIGPRMCIGARLALMEIKTYIIELLSRYDVTWIHPEPAKYSKKSFELRFEGNVWVQLTPRIKK